MKKLTRLYKCFFSLTLITLLISMDAREVSLQEQWENEINQKPQISDSSLLRGKHVVFVSGVMGRELANLIGNYFPDNIEAVEKKLGGTTSYISPSSSLSIPENSNILADKIPLIAEKRDKILALVGHSKGGAELLHMILEHPELIIFGMVEQVLLIQPAIGGSPLIDMSEGFLYNIFLALFNPNMDTLSMNRAKEIFEAAFANYEKSLQRLAKTSGLPSKQLHEIVSSRIFYVQSKIEPDDESMGLSLVLTVLQNNLNSLGIEHDGLLPLTSQYDKRIGKVLGILKVDHLGLTVSTLSNVGKKERIAFMRLIFRIMAEHLAHAPPHL